MSPGREESLHIVNAQERGFSEFWKLRNGSGQCHRNYSRNRQLASGESCLALIPQGSPIRASLNTGQACLQAPPYPSFPCLMGQPELGTESARVCGVAGGLPSEAAPTPSTPGAGYVAQERHSWAKYNLAWAAVPGRDGEAGHSLSCPHPGWVSGASFWV